MLEDRSFTETLCARQVHAYAAAPGGRTAYLAELKSGSEVVVADAQGRQRTAIVGRVKVERRPLVRSTPCKNLCRFFACLSSLVLQLAFNFEL